MQASRVRLHVEDSGGNGQPVVLIHGWLLSAEAWKLQIPALREAGFRVIAYDRRGFGRSDKPEDGYDYDALADDLAGLMEELDLQKATLVGFSMGSGEVVRYIARHGQERVRSVVFAAPVTPYLMKGEDNPEGPFTQDHVDDMREALERDRKAFFNMNVELIFSDEDRILVSEAIRRRALAVCEQGSQQAILGCLESFVSTDFRADMEKITVPALVVHGDSDTAVPFEGSGMRTHAALSGSDLVILGDAPHCCNISHSRAFNEALLTFLRR